MELVKKINEDLINAMKNKNQAALRGIRAIKSALLLARTENKNKEVSTEDEIKILQRLVKQRKESIEIYKSQGREDLVLEEMEELGIISGYLPDQLSVDELNNIIKNIISEVGANSVADLGKVIPNVMKRISGKADGKTVSELVRKQLSEK